MMKILLLNGNNEQESLSASICDAYKQGTEAAGHEVVLLNINQMKFDPVLYEGYRTIQELEPDLVSFQKHLLWANHFVVVYPTWWGGQPALLKGLFDRALYSGFAFKYHEKGPLWDKLLKGRSAHIITTMDAPYMWYWYAYRCAGTHMLKDAILKFCGISPVKTSYITRVKYKTKEQLAIEIEKIKNRAKAMK